MRIARAAWAAITSAYFLVYGLLRHGLTGKEYLRPVFAVIVFRFWETYYKKEITNAIKAGYSAGSEDLGSDLNPFKDHHNIIRLAWKTGYEGAYIDKENRI